MRSPIKGELRVHTMWDEWPSPLSPKRIIVLGGDSPMCCSGPEEPEKNRPPKLLGPTQYQLAVVLSLLIGKTRFGARQLWGQTPLPDLCFVSIVLRWNTFALVLGIWTKSRSFQSIIPQSILETCSSQTPRIGTGSPAGLPNPWKPACSSKDPPGICMLSALPTWKVHLQHLSLELRCPIPTFLPSCNLPHSSCPAHLLQACTI